jgi:hypothetical protein
MCVIVDVSHAEKCMVTVFALPDGGTGACREKQVA